MMQFIYAMRQSIYAMRQKKCGFKVGDTVKVLRKAKTHERGWGDKWVGEMDDFVGKYCKVIGIDKHLGIGIQSMETGATWNFPFFVLQK